MAIEYSPCECSYIIHIECHFGLIFIFAKLYTKLNHDSVNLPNVTKNDEQIGKNKAKKFETRVKKGAGTCS